MRDLLRIARLRPLQSSWTALPSTTLRTAQNCQRRTAWSWSHVSTRRSPQTLAPKFFSRRDVHYHFSKPPAGTPQQPPPPPPPPGTPQGQQPGQTVRIVRTSRKWRPIKLFTGALLSFAAGAGLILYMLVQVIVVDGEGTTLNYDTFVPYTVVSTYPVSPTSFVLTVRPAHDVVGPVPYLQDDGTWWDFIWSVQVKQPELQIQREYTPLPPSEHDDELDLRFFIRRCDGGEVSSYLAKLREGDEVELRMGTKSFDFSYMKAAEPVRFLCLAGGTGVAVALQAIYTLFKDPSRLHPDTTATVLWATRSPQDVYVDPRGGLDPDPERTGTVCHVTTPEESLWDPTAPEAGFAAATPITRRLLAYMQDLQPHLDVHVFIDGLSPPITTKTVLENLPLPTKNKNKNTKTAAAATAISYPENLPRAMAASCRPHNNVGVGAVLADATDMVLTDRVYAPIFVSGPDGFVDRFVGPRVRRDGAWFRAGGVLAQLNAEHGDPDDPWLVRSFN